MGLDGVPQAQAVTVSLQDLIDGKETENRKRKTPNHRGGKVFTY
jgi:hypothetical protein